MSLLRGSIVLFLIAGQIAFASGADSGTPKLIRGVITTREGRPVAGAVVEIFDLNGTQIANGTTSDEGRFEISTIANQGEYELVVTNSKQLNDERIALGRTDVDIKLTVSGTPNPFFRQPQFTVSARQLEIPEKARAHVASAQEEFNRVHLDAARRELDSALRIDPRCSEAWSMRAFVKLAVKDLSGAVEDATEATRIDPDNPGAYVALGTAENSLKSFQQAEVALQRAVELDPNSWQAQLELAKTWYGEKRFVLALRQLALIDSDYPDVHLVRANVLMSLGRQRGGADEFGIFLREAPGDPRSGQIRRIMADVESASDAPALK